MNILFYLGICIDNGRIFNYGFLCSVRFSKEKYIRVKKKKLLEKFERQIIFQVFVNNSRIQCKVHCMEQTFMYSGLY